jgi:YHS domain-containing protein
MATISSGSFFPLSMTVKDPDCGTSVDPDKSAHHADHDCKAYYFCSASCRTISRLNGAGHAPKRAQRPGAGYAPVPVRIECRIGLSKCWIGREAK